MGKTRVGLRDIEERLAGCWRECRPGDPVASPIDTRRALRTLGEATALGPVEAESVDALCRKIHVAGRVATGYEPGWRKSAGSAQVPHCLWPVIVLVLLRLSAVAGETSDEWQSGMAWKCLNAAFAAIDLAEREGVDVAELTRLAAQRLEAAAG